MARPLAPTKVQDIRKLHHPFFATQVSAEDAGTEYDSLIDTDSGDEPE